jgi:hypothetical protein
MPLGGFSEIARIPLFFMGGTGFNQTPIFRWNFKLPALTAS